MERYPSESEIDDSDRDDDFRVKDCTLNSSDSDEISLAEIKRRKLKPSSHSSVIIASSSKDASTSNADACQLAEPCLRHDQVPTEDSSPIAQAGRPSTADEGVANAQTVAGEEAERGRSKKRMRNEQNWKKNVIKTMRHSGQSFTSERGKQIPARKLAPPCPSSCPKKCTAQFSEEARESIFETFWATGDRIEQRHFISSVVEKDSIKRTKTKEKKINRQVTYRYHFWKENTKVQVCRTFFLNTLGVKKDFVMGTVNRRDKFGILQRPVSGKHDNRKQWSREALQNVKKHIESFPHVDSHYCRKETAKAYLDQNLSLNEMYRLYEKKCEEDGIGEVVSKDKYRRVFTEEYNLSFFRPKKDLCDECVGYENKSNPSEEEVQRHAKHLEYKEAARELKRETKEKSLENNMIASCCFDMQQLLPCPKSNSSSFFYKRKLYVHNLTTYDLGTSEACCYMWPEYEAKRGANEVATCLMKFISNKVAQGAREISLFADNCPGQNRNQFVAYMLTVVNRSLDVDKVRVVFLEKGHTETENDSVHSVIERATRTTDLFTPEQWYAAVRSARKSKTPYRVREMSHTEFINFRGMAQSIKNLSVTDSGEKVKWSAARQFSVYGHDKQALYVSYGYDETAVRIDLMRRQRSNGADPTEQTSSSQFIYLTSTCGIPQIKKNDLLSLCHSGLIPPTYTPFYESLEVRGAADDDASDKD